MGIKMKRKFVLTIFVIFIVIFFVNNAINKNVGIDKKEDIDTVIIEQKMNINGHSISIPQISGHKLINKMIIKKIKSYIDKESSSFDFSYAVKHNDRRYISIIIEMVQYKESLPHPGKQAHAINIDLMKNKMLDNNDLVSDKETFFEDIKCGKYVLLSKEEIPNNVSDSSGYVQEKTTDEIKEMFNNGALELYMSNQFLGFIAIVPYAMGNYAIFEYGYNK
jgi:hypothetical protein